MKVTGEERQRQTEKGNKRRREREREEKKGEGGGKKRIEGGRERDGDRRQWEKG